MAADVTYKLNRNNLIEMIKNVLNDESQFNTDKFIYFLDPPEQFGGAIKTVLYGITDPDADIGFYKPASSSKINKAMKPILNDSDWVAALKVATVKYDTNGNSSTTTKRRRNQQRLLVDVLMSLSLLQK